MEGNNTMWMQYISTQGTLIWYCMQRIVHAYGIYAFMYEHNAENDKALYIDTNTHAYI